MALATRSKPATHSKKRQAGHHKHSKHYLKAYWPYIPMLMTIGLGLMINSMWHSQVKVLGTNSDFTAINLLLSTNANRQKYNEPNLSINEQLDIAAQTKANDMVSKNYWSHNSPDGRTPWSFISSSGYTYQIAGENLAYGFDNASDTVTGWMNSQEHRDNILNKNYTNVGFGVASSPNFQGKGPAIIVVAEYAAPAQAVSHISFNVPQVAADTTTAPTEIAAKPVARIQLLTNGQAAWSAIMLSALTGAAIAIMVIRHGYRIRRLLSNGEAFIVHHPILDITIVLLIMIGFILTRTSGIIR